MKPRPYQSEFIEAVLAAWKKYRRVMGVGATGMGKTIIASALFQLLADKRCLFLADAEELIKQNADKFHKLTGEFAAVEMAEFKARLDSRVHVASRQSLCGRLAKYPRDFFDIVVVDEAHRNTLGAQSQAILSHFESALVLGVTGSPHRSDKRQLGSYYEHVAIEVGLERLIREGWLARIALKCIPLPVDLRGLRVTQNASGEKDFKLAELAGAVEPHLLQAAKLLKTHAPGRKTVAFLPLVQTSKKFALACEAVGLRAVHVDGDDKSALSIFTEGGADVACCASLLTTGWDCPIVDCVYPLRPTQSLSLFQQMVGRGTRPIYADGFNPDLDYSDLAGRLDALARGPKRNTLLLDPLFLTDNQKLITPARLLARDEEMFAELAAKLREGAPDAASVLESLVEEMDLLDVDAEVESELTRKREESLRRGLAKASKKKARTVDACEFFLSLHRAEDANYYPVMAWEGEKPTEGQIKALESWGFDPEAIKYRGQASAVLELCQQRKDAGLASPAQVKVLRQFGHPTPDICTAEAARKFQFLAMQFGRERALQSIAPKAEAPPEDAPAPARRVTLKSGGADARQLRTPNVPQPCTQWTSIEGRTIIAAPRSLEKGSVTMKLDGGKVLVLPVSRFAPNDRVRLAQIFSLISH